MHFFFSQDWKLVSFPLVFHSITSLLQIVGLFRIRVPKEPEQVCIQLTVNVLVIASFSIGSFRVSALSVYALNSIRPSTMTLPDAINGIALTWMMPSVN